MNIQLDCPWCQELVDFTVDLADDELACTACNMRMALAPDPAVTFALLYEVAQAA